MEPINLTFKSSGATLNAKFYPAQNKIKPITFLFLPGWPAMPEDFLDLGPKLAKVGIHFLGLYPRGFHFSEGTSSYFHTFEDIGSALRFLRQVDIQKQYNIIPSKMVLGGYSYGGGIALAYAAQDTTIRQIISIAGNDHGEFVREMQRNEAFASNIRKGLRSTQVPNGPIKFDLDTNLQELYEHPEVFGLRENAVKLADRSILLFGGWEDTAATIEQYLLPFYRGLKKSGAQDVTFIVYHTNHSFENVLPELASDITTWLHTVQFPSD